MPYLASAILISSNTPSLPQPTTTTTSTFPLTRVIPDNNFVAYKVGRGDTLKIIAAGSYQDQETWTNIWNDNPAISDPDKLQEGNLIKLRITKPEKKEELDKSLKKIYSKLHPKPVYFYTVKQTGITPPVAPQSSYEDVYKNAGSKYGVPWQILYGIHMTETGCRNGAITSGYGSGAQGPMQFMPGTWNAYGVDGDGDGTVDINNANDAIYAAANYLAKHGSLDNGLRSYGGNYNGTLAYARSKGYDH